MEDCNLPALFFVKHIWMAVSIIIRFILTLSVFFIVSTPNYSQNCYSFFLLASFSPSASLLLKMSTFCLQLFLLLHLSLSLVSVYLSHCAHLHPSTIFLSNTQDLHVSSFSLHLLHFEEKTWMKG